MLYTTPFLRLADTGSLGCTSSCLRVLQRREDLCSAHQCPHYSSFVGCRVVGVKAQILICVGGLTVHRGADEAIFSIQEDVKEGELIV